MQKKAIGGNQIMPKQTRILIMAAAAALTIAGSAHAASSVKLLAMIPVPGEPIESYDIGIVNEKTHLYYQTDRSNKSIDIFDVVKNAFVGRVGGSSVSPATAIPRAATASAWSTTQPSCGRGTATAPSR